MGVVSHTMRPARLLLIVAAGVLTGGVAFPAGAQRGPGSVLIVNATVYDGTGAPGRQANVRVVKGVITQVGALAARATERVIDAGGLALAPGFIDTHSHHDRGLDVHRGALAVVSQGVTTIVAGQDGGSRHPLAPWFATLERNPVAVNVASYVGHGTLRTSVLGGDFRRAATDGEVVRMRARLREDLAAGALGLSSGLEYDPGIYSTTSELVALARDAAAVGGRYISHVRSEDRDFWKAIDEIITIGRDAQLPVQVSHVKLGMRSLWGEADSLLHVLDRARAAGVNVTADIYPYAYWQSTLTVLFPSRDFENRASAEFALNEVSSPEGLLLSAFTPDPSYVGKTVAEIATLRGTDPATTLMALVHESQRAPRTAGGAESVIGTSMDERDIARLLAWPWANICSDGELDGRHPRGFGSFPRVLGRYVRERQVIPLAEAIRKMTSLAAANVGLVGRGTIAPGQAADLVLFDPVTVLDVATPTAPRETSRGIHTVWVNGVVVYAGGSVTGAHPGRVLRRAAAQ